MVNGVIANAFDVVNGVIDEVVNGVTDHCIDIKVASAHSSHAYTDQSMTARS